MDRQTTQGPNMRLPLRPAPAPPKTSTNGCTSRARPPLQRRITDVGSDWSNPWNETVVNQSASEVASITHSMSDMQINSDQNMNMKRKRTPPPRPPPPRFHRNMRTQNNGGASRNSQKSSSSSLLSALFNNRRPARKPHKDGGNGHNSNGRPHRHLNSSRYEDNIILKETNPQRRSRAPHQNKSTSARTSGMMNSTSAPSMLNESHHKTESPPRLLDLLTSSPPSSPVPSSRFGDSTGDTDSLSSDGFSKVGMGGSFPSAFPLDDDPFDPFGEIVDGAMTPSDPWGGDDPFSPAPAPRKSQPLSAFEDPWASSSVTYPQNSYLPSSAATRSGSSTPFASNTSASSEQEDWTVSHQISSPLNSLENTAVWSTSNTSLAARSDSNSPSKTNFRNLNPANVTSSHRPPRASEVPRTMNLAILGAMPTIIRAKPKPRERSQICGMTATEEVSGSSPPMPSIPPPPPPPRALLDDWDGGGDVENPPDLPPRPWKTEQENCNDNTHTSAVSGKLQKQPHGVALFDYPATHADDLAFQTGEVILLIRKINDDWYYGQREIGGSPGMFPTTFIKPVIDLPPENGDESARASWDDREDSSTSYHQNLAENDRTVKALYTFKPEVPEDLEFEEGAIIEVTGQLDSEWLWGHIGNKWGQFPASFVDRVPKFLPQHQL